MPRPRVSSISASRLRLGKRLDDPNDALIGVGHAVLYRIGGMDYVMDYAGNILPLRGQMVSDGDVEVFATEPIVVPRDDLVDLGGGDAVIGFYPLPINRPLSFNEPLGSGSGTYLFSISNIGGAFFGIGGGVSAGSFVEHNGSMYAELLATATLQELASQSGSFTLTVRPSWSPRLHLDIRLSDKFTTTANSGYAWFMLNTYLNATDTITDITTDSFAPSNLTGFGFRIGKAGDTSYYKVRAFLCNNSQTPTFSATEWDVITPDVANDLILDAYYDYTNSQVVFTVNGQQAAMTSPLLTSTASLKTVLLTKAVLYPTHSGWISWRRLMVDYD